MKCGPGQALGPPWRAQGALEAVREEFGLSGDRFRVVREHPGDRSVALSGGSGTARGRPETVRERFRTLPGPFRAGFGMPWAGPEPLWTRN